MLVVFERGKETVDFYWSERVKDFAAKHETALLLAHHCPARGSEDIDVEPSQGLGRMLIAALDQLSSTPTLKDVAKAKLVLFGLSGAGSLTARMLNFLPTRVEAAILIHPGHGDALGIDTAQIGPSAHSIPQFVLTGSTDAVAGTKKPFEYFLRLYKKRAAVVFAIDPEAKHCCFRGAEPLILSWLSDQLRPSTPQNSVCGFFDADWTDTRDTWGFRTFRVKKAVVTQKKSTLKPAGCFASSDTAQKWLEFVQKTTPSEK